MFEVHYPSIHLFVSKSRSVVRGAVVCCVCMRVLCCVVCVGVGVVCMFVSFFCVFYLSFFSQCSSFSFFFSLFLFFFSLLFSPPNTMERTDQPTRRPTSRHLNVIWRRASAQQSVLSLLPSPLPPPFSPSPPQKKEETFYYRDISGEGIIFITVLY